jgi:hypothetical protein
MVPSAGQQRESAAGSASSRSDEFGDSLPTHEKKAANRLMGAKAEGGWAVFVWHPSSRRESRFSSHYSTQLRLRSMLREG